MDIKELISQMEEINPNAIRLNDLDDCLLGICETFEGSRFLYSERKIIEKLMNKGMSETEAIENFEYAILGVHFSEYNPVFLIDL